MTKTLDHLKSVEVIFFILPFIMEIFVSFETKYVVMIFTSRVDRKFLLTLPRTIIVFSLPEYNDKSLIKLLKSH